MPSYHQVKSFVDDKTEKVYHIGDTYSFYDKVNNKTIKLPISRIHRYYNTKPHKMTIVYSKIHNGKKYSKILRFF